MFLPFIEGNELKGCEGFFLLLFLFLVLVAEFQLSLGICIIHQIMIDLRNDLDFVFGLICRAENEPTLRLSNGITLVVGFQHYVR